MSIGETEEGLNTTDFPPFGAPVIAGDPHDDDAQVMESMLVEVDAPAERPADSPAIQHKTAPKRVAQLLSGFQVIDLNNLNSPQCIMPADPDRKDFSVEVFGSVATDSIRIADSPNKLHYPAIGGTSGQSRRLLVGKIWHPTDYTGAVWIIGTDITAPVTVTWDAVTD